jgi:hypothetical protein
MIVIGGIAPLRAQITGAEQDCFNAIPVCNGVYSQTNSYTGTGTIGDEIPNGAACLPEEKNDVWYIFTVRTSGNLSFEITPIDPDNDYDWVVYNLTGRFCSDIRTGAVATTSCNYSRDVTFGGRTGASDNNPGAPTSQPATGTPFNRVISVVAGETYVLNVSNFSDLNQTGYRLEFGASTAQIFDQTPPLFQAAHPPAFCDSNKVAAIFSENVKCSSVQTTDFRLTGPGGPYTITGVSADACANGGGFDDTYLISFTPALPSAGTYTLEIINDADGVLDICDNRALPAQKSFLAAPIGVPTISIDGPTTLCSCQQLILSAPSGYAGYQWSNGETTQSINVKDGGDYTVTVSNRLGCTSTSSAVRVSRVDAESTINLPAEEVHGSPGDTVTIPIDIASSRFLDFCGARNYTIRISYNRNILKALDGTCVETRGDTCILELKGTRGDTLGELARPRFIAMLGNAENTPLVIESAGWDECGTLTLTNGGGFQLDNLCREGGTRLYRSGPPATLKPLTPSPIKGSVAIDYTLGVDSHARITFTNLMGDEVAVVMDGDRRAGDGRIVADLSHLVPGLYICTLTAQGETHTQMVEVIR